MHRLCETDRIVSVTFLAEPGADELRAVREDALLIDRQRCDLRPRLRSPPSRPGT